MLICGGMNGDIIGSLYVHRVSCRIMPEIFVILQSPLVSITMVLHALCLHCVDQRFTLRTKEGIIR